MWAKNVRYLDYNATSGITGSVRTKLSEILSQNDFFFANPSSQHRLGQQSQQWLMRARMKIASSLGKNIDINELVFTSSGSEANQTVIRSAMKSAEVMIIGAGEHSASFDLLSEIPTHLKKIELPLLENGQYDFNYLKNILDELKQSGKTKVFLSLFWANNETGVITPLVKLHEVIKSSGLNISLHLDAAQVWGKIEIELSQSPANFITFSGHKVGAPAGVGIIWMRPGSTLIPLITGSQSNGLRGGTENILAISALSFAVEELNIEKFIKNTSNLRSQLEVGLRDLNVKIWGTDTDRISNTCRFSVLGFEQYENLVELLDLKGFAVSHGSACKSKIVEPSRVLLRMGASKAEALNAIRISFGPSNQSSDVDDFLIAFKALLSEKVVDYERKNARIP